MTAREDEDFMRRALRLASSVARRGEVPVGAIAVQNGEVIAAAGNAMERRGDATAHAEMLVLRAAARRTGSWRLNGVSVYCTLEPCPMCAGAMVQARIARCVYGARDPKKGADGSVYSVLQHRLNNHRVEVVAPVLGDDCGALLTDFFRRRRAQG